MHSLLMIIAILAAGLNLTACDFGSQGEPPMRGKRVSVLTHEHTLKLEKSLPSHITLPKKSPSEVAEFISQVWQTKKGGNTGSTYRCDHMLSHLIATDKRVYLSDSRAVVYAIDSQSGNTLWKTDLLSKIEELDTLLIGGFTYKSNQYIIITTGWGSVIALHSDTGTEWWRHSIGGGIPMRTAPTIGGSRVFIVNRENEVRALAIESGNELWYRRGVAEITSLLGGAAPLVDGSTVVVPLSSGELVALCAENGKQMWSAPLTARQHIVTIENFNNIISHHIIHKEHVYAVTHSGLMVAININSGERLWERALGSYYPPIVANDFLFVLTTDGDLVALEAQNGRVLWITELPRRKKSENFDERIYWTGPVLAGDRLVVTSLEGIVITISPYTGSLLGESELQAELCLSPVIADKRIFFLTRNGNLFAYQ